MQANIVPQVQKVLRLLYIAWSETGCHWRRLEHYLRKKLTKT